MSKAIIIIGTGLAGYNLAREIRKRDEQVALTLVTRDDGAFYSKPMLSNGFAKDKLASDLPMANADKMRQDLNASIHTDTSVTNIDAEQKIVELDSGDTLAYDKLVLASGAVPIQFPMDGDAANQVLTVNDLQDYAHFRETVAGKKSVAIIGPGLIGSEFANDLAGADYQVHVIGPDNAPLGRLLPPEAGGMLQEALAALGVQWHLQTLVTAINKQQDQFRLSLKNGEEISVDVVLSAIGLKPDLTLAKQADLQTNRGIVTNRYLQTSSKDIYALGDCAEVEDLVLPFVMPLMHCARALAATLTGEATEVVYPAMPVVVKTPAHPVVVSPPPFEAPGEWEVEALADGVRALFKAGEDLLGFALTGSAVSEKQALTRLLPAVLP
jgi:rubredoxin-NAD+ reductase